MTESDKRVSVRVPVSFRVEFIHKENYIISFNRDISMDGMFICTQVPPEIGSHLRLLFSLKEIGVVEIPAIVVWANTAGPAKEHGMGVQFLEPPPPDLKNHIMSLVDRVVVLQKNMSFA